MANDIVGSARLKIEIDASDVDRQARDTSRRLKDRLKDGFKGSGRDAADEFIRDATGRLRHSRSRFVAEGDHLGRGLAAGAGRGASVLGDALGEARGSLQRLVATAGTAGALTVALAGSANAAVGLAAALAPAAGIVATLPAGVGLLAASMSTLRLATVGVSDAFEAALVGDAEEFSSTVSRLAPAARAVAVELRNAAPAIDRLRRSVQGSFFSPLQGEIRGLVTALRGPLTDGASAAAVQLGRLSTVVAKFARSSAGVTLVDQVFQSLETTLGNIRSDTVERLLGAVSRFTISTLGEFEDLGTAIDNTLNRFSGFLEEAASSGDGIRWIEDAVTVFRQLGEIVGEVTGIIGEVFSAADASGTNALAGLLNILERVGDFLESPPGQDALAAVFEASAVSGQLLGDVLSELLDTFGPLIPAIATVVTSLGNLAPAASIVGGILTPLVDLVAGLADVFGSLPGPLQAAVLALTALVVMRDRVRTFGDTLNQLPQRLSSQAVTSATRRMTALRTGLSGLMNVVGGPWGLAITAGVTAISIFGQRQQEAAQKVADLTATLDTQTGAMTANTRQWIANELHQRGILQLARQMGIDTALVTSAVLGEADALKQLNQELDASFDAAAQRADSDLPATLEGELVNANTLRDAVRDLSGTYQDATAGAKLKAEASRELNLAEQTAAVAIKSVSDAIREQADLLRAQADPAFAFQQALETVADKQKAYNDAVKDNKRESGEARRAALDLAVATTDLATAASGLGETFTGKLTPDMRETLRAAGLTKNEIAGVQQALKDTKKAAQDYEGNYRAKVEVSGARAARELIRGLQGDLRHIDRTVRIGIVANVTGLSQLPAFAEGGIVDRPTVALIGEEYRREVVIPLTKPARARDIAEKSGLTALLDRGAARSSDSGTGGRGRGGDRHVTQNVTHTWHIHGADDPDATARRVVRRLEMAAFSATAGGF